MCANTAEMLIRPFEPADEPELVELWQTCGLTVPHNDPHRDIAVKQTAQPELFLVGRINGRLAASLMAGFDGHRGWVYYLGVHPDFRGQGLARALLKRTEAALKALGCPKLNLMVRSSNQGVIGFYEHLGYKQEQVLCLGKPLKD